MKSFAHRRAALPVLGCLAAASMPLCAQQLAQPASGVVQPSPVPQLEQTSTSQPTTFVEAKLTLGQTITSNVALKSGGDSDAITRISPGLYVSSHSGRVQGFLNYALAGVAYARTSGSNSLNHQLSANASAELLERRAYIDAKASIMQQAVNPLGVDSEDSQLGRSNRSEVRTVQLAPRVEGRLGDLANWDASVSHRATHSVSASSSDSSSTQWRLQVGNAAQQRTTTSWTAQLSHNVQDFSLGRRTANDIARGVVDWRFAQDVFAGVIAGYESSDIASEDMQGRATYGLRAGWAPSERTNLFAETEKRFFGNAHTLRFSHRMARSLVSYSDTRTISYGLGQPLTVGHSTVYDFFDQLYTSSEPDASAREAKVLQVLRDNGYSATDATNLLPAFLSSSVTLQRAQQMTYGWTGVRDTFTVSLQQTTGRRVDNREVFGDPFSVNSGIRQRGLSMSLAHRLTPLSTLTLGLTQRRSIGDVNSSKLRSMTAQLSTKLGPRTSFSLLARRASSKGSSQPYTESALVGTFAMTF
ncbi:TIGR03016 family PEP-CTERM system-associated outer membrane protein [Azohydromonas lata]|uniref:TIGR03016 family PEP-CTERM system-associated outer membrane protein n=1 Tax=Azohydromonas lata TaxID=45677 RepID=A0ABU5IKH1_9BURK|nr:TIGR03016 family PEP-CTERM system-associated outer membrane protein [Azohydromonas lata]MDZ5459395.1 TIGR03016 family PEP-CTERM system-associated outer membrane protein [Azohydromonas lata]